MTTHGTVNWTELNTRDVKKAKDFYGKTLGWTFEEMAMPNGPYVIAKASGEQVAGIQKMPPGMDGVPDNWFTYFAVKDLDAVLKKAKSAGGKVMQEPFDVPGVGRIAIVADANGAASGWMVPAER